MLARTTWFEDVFGFIETPDNVIKYMRVDDVKLIITRSDGGVRKVDCGHFYTKSIACLNSTLPTPSAGQKCSISVVVGDVRDYHVNARPGSIFQVASQVNCLEMANCYMTPAHGITIYDRDRTQGPICALMCPYGAIMRNYFIQHDGANCPPLRDAGHSIGQCSRQLNMMAPFLQDAKISGTVMNGYLHVDSDTLRDKNSDITRAWRKIQVGIHENLIVYNSPRLHKITQIYTAAYPGPSSRHGALAMAMLLAAY